MQAESTINYSIKHGGSKSAGYEQQGSIIPLYISAVYKLIQKHGFVFQCFHTAWYHTDINVHLSLLGLGFICTNWCEDDPGSVSCSICRVSWQDKGNTWEKGIVITLILWVKSECLRKQGWVEVWEGLRGDSCAPVTLCLPKEIYTSKIQRAAGKLQLCPLHLQQNERD